MIQTLVESSVPYFYVDIAKADLNLFKLKYGDYVESYYVFDQKDYLLMFIKLTIHPALLTKLVKELEYQGFEFKEDRQLSYYSDYNNFWVEVPKKDLNYFKLLFGDYVSKQIRSIRRR